MSRTTSTAVVVLVTGAARGLGRDIVRRFALAGASVVASDAARPNETLAYEIATEDDLEQTLAAIRETGGEGIAVRADVRSEPDVEALLGETVARYGRLDVLVNNAGVYTGGPVTELREEEWDAALDVNLKGPFLCAKHAARHMSGREGGGRIISISSTSALVGIPDQVGYQASKHGVVGFDAHARPRARPARSHRQHRVPDGRPHADARLPDRDRAGVLPGGRAAVRRVDGLPGARCARSA